MLNFISIERLPLRLRLCPMLRDAVPLPDHARHLFDLEQIEAPVRLPV